MTSPASMCGGSDRHGRSPTLRLRGDSEDELGLLLEALGPPTVNPYHGDRAIPEGGEQP